MELGEHSVEMVGMILEAVQEEILEEEVETLGVAVVVILEEEVEAAFRCTGRAAASDTPTIYEAAYQGIEESIAGLSPIQTVDLRYGSE